MSPSPVYFMERERRTFYLHVSYSIIEGVILGVLALNEFVFIKSLQGSTVLLGVLFQFSNAVFVLLIFFNEFLKRVKNKKKMVRLVAIFTRLPLLLLFFFPRDPALILQNPGYHYLFLGIFFLFYLEAPITYPLINLLLKGNYRHESFGKLFSHATSLHKGIVLIVTFLYGIVLDIDHFAFTYVFPIIAVLGVISLFLLSKIEYTHPEDSSPSKPFIASIKQSASTMVSVIKKNVPFRHFEIGFMLYGFAFMTTATVITIFFDRALHLNYSSVAFYKNGFNIIAIILIPLFGRIIGRIDPRRFAAFTFLSMMLAILALAVTEYFPLHIVVLGIDIYYVLLFYIVFYGVFMATMTLLWRIGSAYFCTTEEVGLYQAVHLSATGIRALFAPLLGVLFYEMVGFFWTFCIALVSLACGIVVMLWSYRREQLTITHDDVKSL